MFSSEQHLVYKMICTGYTDAVFNCDYFTLCRDKLCQLSCNSLKKILNYLKSQQLC